MATVYSGRHRALDQQRAVKVMSPSLAAHQSFVQLFYREARLAAGLRHPNVVQIYDVAQQDGLAFLVMELLEGRSLHQIILDERPLSLTRIAHLVKSLASALDHAHAQGIAHRDVKPANVFVNNDDHVTLVDFGIARAADGTHLTVTSGIGTPQYMAPEIFDEQLARPEATRHQLGVDADMYALGVVAYELISGHVPFSGRTPQAVGYAHVHHLPPSLRPGRSDLAERAELLVLRQLSKDPSRRINSSGAFAMALEAALGPDPRLAECDEALRRDDLDRVERLLTEFSSEGLAFPGMTELGRRLALRRTHLGRRSEFSRLVIREQWQAAVTTAQWLEQSGETGFGEIRQLTEAVRDEALRRILAERRADDEAEARVKLEADIQTGAAEIVQAAQKRAESIVAAAEDRASAVLADLEKRRLALNSERDAIEGRIANVQSRIAVAESNIRESRDASKREAAEHIASARRRAASIVALAEARAADMIAESGTTIHRNHASTSGSNVVATSDQGELGDSLKPIRDDSHRDDSHSDGTKAGEDLADATMPASRPETAAVAMHLLHAPALETANNGLPQGFRSVGPSKPPTGSKSETASGIVSVSLMLSIMLILSTLSGLVWAYLAYR